MLLAIRLAVYLQLICFQLAIASDDKKYCMEESTNEKLPVTWPNSFTTNRKIVSDPLCLTEKKELITRNCNEAGWVPKSEVVPKCNVTRSRPLMELCPPNFMSLLDDDKKIKYCYNLTSADSWNDPCSQSGSTITVLDLDEKYLTSLMNNLKFADRKLVWLPAKRIMPYGPVVWTLLGERYGKSVKFDKKMPFTRLSIVQNCLLLDLDKMSVKTDNCSYQYPSLCITKNKHLAELHCPPGYYASRYGLNDGRCYGMEIADNETTWKEFQETRCPQPMTIENQIENGLFRELAKEKDYDLEKNMCWIGLTRIKKEFFWYPKKTVDYINWDSQTDFTKNGTLKGAINEKYRWLLLDENDKLKCMVCQVESSKIDVEMSLSLTTDSKRLHLTIYHPDGLWKTDKDDAGVQCFSNVKGFMTTVDVDDDPYKKVKYFFRDMIPHTLNNVGMVSEIGKSVYEVSRESEESGEYWCFGHNSRNFSLIKTPIFLVASKKEDEHMFVLKLHVYNICTDPTLCNPDWYVEANHIKSILNAKTVRIMEISPIGPDGSADILYHVSVELNSCESCKTKNCLVLKTFYNLLEQSTSVFLPNKNQFIFLSLKSTMYCMPIENDDEYSLHWEMASIGDNIAPKEFCMQSNGLPVTRMCGGSFLAGGKWDTVLGTCSENFEATNRTSFLYSLAKGKTDMNTTSSFLSHDLISILNDKEDIIPADIYFLAMSMKLILHISETNTSVIEVGDTVNIATAIDSIMNIEEAYLNLAQTMNSSNVLLESLDLIFIKISSARRKMAYFKDEDKNGIDIAVTPQFIIQISDPSINNITGLALVRREGVNSTLFTDLEIIHLTANMTVFDIMAIKGLEIATWLTQEILDTILHSNQTGNVTEEHLVAPKIIIDMFYSDVVFQETKTEKDVVNSRVISVTIPGHESDLSHPLPLIYRRFDKNSSSDRACAYWDFATNKHLSMGQWSKEGCYHVASHEELDVCVCFHLTHFAQLVLGYRGNNNGPTDQQIQTYHGRALNAITLVGCSLSLIGVAGIGATAILFRSWRQKPGTKVLLQLSTAIALQSFMIVSQDISHGSDVQCIALGALLHYSVLAAFTWMLLTALLQFARYVKVLGTQRPARFMMKFSVVGWGLPILPVAILLLVDSSAYLPPPVIVMERSVAINAHDPLAICYPQGLSLYLTVLLPICCIVLTNLTVFVLVLLSIMRGPDGKLRFTDSEMVYSQLRLSVLLFFLLGLSWIFGLLAITGGEILFSYLFCLTATLQGFVLFVYFVVCDPATRVLWVSFVRERSRSLSKELSG